MTLNGVTTADARYGSKSAAAELLVCQSCVITFQTLTYMATCIAAHFAIVLLTDKRLLNRVFFFVSVRLQVHGTELVA